MDAVLKFLMAIWTYFAQNILQQPAFMIGLIVLVGYLLEKKKWYEVISGFLKATVGYFILVAGSNGLVQSFR
ncbi:PTS ascorbate transporter subunit IIC, partial [Blautia sp. DFI.9.9]|nr:PTS ascorbate transporter subunit IIC [Blautia sp. DFI.9.9]